MTLSEDKVKEEIKKIFIELFEIPEAKLTDEARLYEDLGLDSIDAIDLVVSFEKHFKVKPPLEELQKIRTLTDVYSLLNKYYGESQKTTH